MPMESFIQYKNETLVVNSGYLIAFYLFLFEKIHLSATATDKFKALKLSLADDALYMVAIEWITSTALEELIEGIEDDISVLIDNIIEELKNSKTKLTNDNINYIIRIAGNYYAENANSEYAESYHADIDARYGSDMPSENYIKAFEEIRQFLKVKN